MSVSPDSRVGLAVALLVATAAGALLAGVRRDPARDSAAQVIHGLTGGVGLGPALDPARCARAFDPRLAPTCDDATGALPGTGFACPHTPSSWLTVPRSTPGTVPE